MWPPDDGTVAGVVLEVAGSPDAVSTNVIRSLKRDECDDVILPWFNKQLGSDPEGSGGEGQGEIGSSEVEPEQQLVFIWISLPIGLVLLLVCAAFTVGTLRHLIRS